MMKGILKQYGNKDSRRISRIKDCIAEYMI